MLACGTFFLWRKIMLISLLFFGDKKMKNFLLFFLFVFVLIYIAKKSNILKKIAPNLDNLIDYFNYSRHFTESEQKKIVKMGNELYGIDREEMVKKGTWKFPSMACADLLAKKYNLDEFKRDALATYKSYKDISWKLGQVTAHRIGGSVKLTEQEIKNLCESA